MLKQYPKFNQFILGDACRHNNVETVRTQLNFAGSKMNLYYGPGRPFFFLTLRTNKNNESNNESQEIITLFLNWIKDNKRTINFSFPDSTEENSPIINLPQEMFQRKCSPEQLKIALDVVNADFLKEVQTENEVFQFLNDLAFEHELDKKYDERNKYTLAFIETLFEHFLFQNKSAAFSLVRELFFSDERLNMAAPEPELLEGLTYIRHYLDNNEVLNQELSFDSILLYHLLFSQKSLINFLDDESRVKLEASPYQEYIDTLKNHWESNSVQTLSADNIPDQSIAPSTARVSQTGMYALGKRQERQESQDEQDFPSPKKR